MTPPSTINEQSWIDHQQIQAIADREKIDYSQAFAKFYEREQTSSVVTAIGGIQVADLSEESRASVNDHLAIEGIAASESIDYSEAAARHFASNPCWWM